MTTSPFPAPRPVVIFDGDCAICTTLAGVVERRLRPPAVVQPWQRLDLAAYGLSDVDCLEALQYVDADGRVFAAELAVARLLRASRPWARPAGFVIALPGIRSVAGLIYRWVARNRSRLPGGTAACAVPPPAAPVD
ncbi:MAG TPA: DCC1-like thiol-disulfide oxidoreductase family protein [Kineosporiaceae bacterium]|nr:DCC1-like thiol-disulfide oxidoreductase family protein [Kineosporiaceae bacterium]